MSVKIADLFKVEGYGVIVTGGASGLGLGFTEALAENGAKVTMLDIDAKRIETEVARLKAPRLPRARRSRRCARSRPASTRRSTTR